MKLGTCFAIERFLRRGSSRSFRASKREPRPPFSMRNLETGSFSSTPSNASSNVKPKCLYAKTVPLHRSKNSKRDASTLCKAASGTGDVRL